MIQFGKSNFFILISRNIFFFFFRFEGEDCNKMQRLKEQKEQMQSWVMQQMNERRAAEKESRDAEKAYQDAVVARDKRAIALELMEEECRRRLREATAKFNKALVSRIHFIFISIFSIFEIIAQH